ncbi:hypothetical protein BDN72DRAFT_864887 [Pluteus cervinus]|uniref:Uncharacterized protein n=1 Tax=Pluteus cervinus TaxID=181527 RepID=A0ACD3A398_9AGAR|nr:hypothetical protein BDN72DRAFT_864887 [Pluteus cervinus]
MYGEGGERGVSGKGGRTREKSKFGLQPSRSKIDFDQWLCCHAARGSYRRRRLPSRPSRRMACHRVYNILYVLVMNHHLVRIEMTASTHSFRLTRGLDPRPRQNGDGIPPGVVHRNFTLAIRLQHRPGQHPAILEFTILLSHNLTFVETFETTAR